MTNEFDIIDHPMVIFWMKELLKSEPLALATMTEGNIQRFRKMFGDEDGKTQRFQYWRRDHLGVVIYIYSDKKNTYYKTQYLGDLNMFVQDKKIGSYLTGFLTKLQKEMLSN